MIPGMNSPRKESNSPLVELLGRFHEETMTAAREKEELCPGHELF
jgi:hypothetical protein